MKVRVGVVALVLGALSLTSVAPAREAYEQTAKIQDTEQDLAALRSENERLQQRLDRLQDPDYVEKLAREQLGLVRPGEISYVVVPPPPVTKTVTAKETSDRPPHKKVWDWMKSLF